MTNGDQYCRGCGARRQAGARFCLGCGEAYGAPAARSASATQGWRHLGWAGVAPVLLFFLPWITVSCQSMGVSQSYSGWTIASGITFRGPFGQVQRVAGEPALFIIPAAALVFGLLFLAVSLRLGRQIPFLAGGALVAACAGGLVTLFKYMRWSEDVQRQSGGLITLSPAIGWLLTLLCWILAGAGAAAAFVESRRIAGLELPRRAAGSAPNEPDSLVGPPMGSPAMVEEPSSQPVPSDLQFCTRCGARTQPSAGFCVECGASLRGLGPLPGVSGVPNG